MGQTINVSFSDIYTAMEPNCRHTTAEIATAIHSRLHIEASKKPAATRLLFGIFGIKPPNMRTVHDAAQHTLTSMKDCGLLKETTAAIRIRGSVTHRLHMYTLSESGKSAKAGLGETAKPPLSRQACIHEKRRHERKRKRA